MHVRHGCLFTLILMVLVSSHAAAEENEQLLRGIQAEPGAGLVARQARDLVAHGAGGRTGVAQPGA